MDQQLNDAVIDATKKTIKTFFDIEATNSKPQHAESVVPCEEMCAVIGLTGGYVGLIKVNCLISFAQRVSKFLMGEESPPGSKALKDCVGEFLNTIAGSAKRFFEGDTDPYLISIPTVVAGKNLRVYTMKGNSIAYIEFDIGGEKLTVEIVLK